MEKINKKAQVWIETVLYTLIAIVLIGLVLGFITPKINESRDNLVVEQSIDALNVFDEKIEFVQSKGIGNRVVIPEFSLKKGELFVDSPGNMIKMVIGGLTTPYTEPGVEVSFGKVKVLSEKGAKTSNVTLTLSYAPTDIQYNDGNEIKKFTTSAIPYKFFIEQKGAYVNIREEGTAASASGL